MSTLLPSLYSRSLTGDILKWSIFVSDNTIITTYGRLYGGKIRQIRRVVTSAPNRKSLGEHAMSIAQRKHLDKIDKDGYLEFKGGTDQELHNFCTSIPINKTDSNKRLKPAKAYKGYPKKFLFPCIAQPKLNGLRGVLRLEKVESEFGGIFNASELATHRAVIRSKNGLEYIMPHITDDVDIAMFGENGDLVFDGELYAHGLGLNLIRASCPTQLASGTITTPSGNPIAISFVIFDLSIPDISQHERLGLMLDIVNDYDLQIYYNPIGIELSPIAFLGYIIARSREHGMELMLQYIRWRFEGAIVRQREPEYAFGSRTVAMAKLKQFEDTECKVLDIIFKNKVDDRTYISFILQNDINDATFEATPEGDEKQRLEYLEMKHLFINAMATVKFYERSGIKKVPFHANVVAIRGEADLGL